MSTLKRIRNVYFSYRKSGVVSFFLDVEWKKVKLFGFFENYSLKNVELCGSSGSYCKKMKIRDYSGKKLKKNGVLAVFHVLNQESEYTFGVSVTIA